MDFGNQFPGAPRWIEVGVRTNGGGPFTPLMPRQRVTATPYAVTAGTISGALPAGQLTGTVPLAQLPASVVTNGASGVNISGTFTGSGAGVTNVNLVLNSGGAITWPGNFALAASPGVGSLPQAVTAADVNGDGKPDLISADSGANTLTVLTNNGSGGFVLASSPGVGSVPTSVTSADVNGDGKPDLISANYDANTVTVLFNAASLFTGSFAGNGSGLTALNAETLTGVVPPAALTSVPAGSLTDTIADARLSANVALRAGGNTFSDNQTFTGNNTIASPASLSFGSQTRQMINLWNTSYGIGVQADAAYFRTGNDFHWYWGGSHSDANGNAGSGGAPLMSLKSSGRLGLGITNPDFPLDAQSGLAVGRFTTTNHANGAVLVLRNTSASPTYLGAINFEDSTTPGQIGYLASGQMTFRVGGADRMNLQAGGLYVNGALVPSSDRNMKEDFAAVDAQAMLEKVAALPLQTWSYTNRPGVKHVGPMAQDFRAAFGLGEDDKHIATVDADGVALAAIQGLNLKMEAGGRKSEDRSRKLEARLRQKETEITELKQRLDALEQIVHRLKPN